MSQWIIEVPEENVELLLALLPKFNARLIRRLSVVEESVIELNLNKRPQYPIHDCEMMRYNLETWFLSVENVDNADAIISYDPVFDEYGLPIYDGESSKISIDYCPWCGDKLAESKRNEWFTRLEKLNIDTTDETQIPESFKSDSWYHPNA